MEKFRHLNLSEGLLEAIHHEGFESPSEVQEKTIPLVLAGKDVIGSSATGSGKTLAFGAGMIDMTAPGAGLQALILTPTRELAEQVGQTIAKFSHKKRLRVVQVYGGVSMNPQISNLRHADIVVGTPGRLLDHLKRGTLNLSRVKFLVLDEADRMLDMGFIRDVEFIIKSCPLHRQTLLFSATISQDIEYMAKKYMKNPVRVTAGERVDPSKLCQVYYEVSQETKFSLLAHLLKQEKNGVVMVFCNTRRNTDKVTRNLGANGIHAKSIHGGHSQNKRSSVLQAFHSKDIVILVCTDIAARGLDIKDVSHVYNYDVPKTGREYIHRIGRTARAGKNGIAISFVSREDFSEFKQMERHINAHIEKQPSPTFAIVQTSAHKPSSGQWQGRSGWQSRGQRRFGSDARHDYNHGSDRDGKGSFGRKKGSFSRHDSRSPSRFGRR